MNDFLSLDEVARKRLMINTSRKLHMSPAIIEKDFWVCFMLDYLFTSFKFSDFICFKGGTSLSKVYHCIERFSEDIDLALDWTALDLSKKDAYIMRSNRQQEIFNKNANLKVEKYLKEVWLPLMKKDISEIIDDEFDLYIEEHDPQTICFQYPKSYQETSILQVIRLEVGMLAEPIPSEFKTISTYISECYPQAFTNETTKARTVSIHRTFFEKITILHREANRINGNYPSRYSRHFYDVYQMIQKDIANQSIKHLEILKNVIAFKKKFYPCNWAKYDEIYIGECKLIPKDEALRIFSNDYENMKQMLYGKYPAFSEIVTVLSEFEEQLNAIIKQSLYEIKA